jgi:hypothetical protein
MNVTPAVVDTKTLIAMVVAMLENEPQMTDRRLYYRLLADGVIENHENAYNLVQIVIHAGRARSAALAAQEAADAAEKQALFAEHAAKLHAAWAEGEIAAGRGDDLRFSRFEEEGGLAVGDEEKNPPQPVGGDERPPEKQTIDPVLELFRAKP